MYAFLWLCRLTIWAIKRMWPVLAALLKPMPKDKRTRKYKRAKRLKKAGGFSLIIIGLTLGLTSMLITWHAQQSAAAPIKTKQALKNNAVVKNQTPLISGTPVHIAIPSVAIDLTVIPGYYYPESNSWTLSLDDAQYGAMTAQANNKEGDTFIYAHYRLNVFYTLPKIQPGAQAIVTTDNGHVFTYTFVSSTVTSPSDTSLFSYKGKPILVLQTCTGLWYQDRQLFTFNLTSVK